MSNKELHGPLKFGLDLEEELNNKAFKQKKSQICLPKPFSREISIVCFS